jgi:hypothetical protein
MWGDNEETIHAKEMRRETEENYLNRNEGTE